MIDGALRTMIDEVLISARKMSGPVVAPRNLKRHVRDIMLAPTASLFDQSILTDRAERLVKAARAAGADSADAVAVRGVTWH
jgi:predicted Rdx family selenoprotein